jgi:predicted transcriptional regulator
MAEILEMSLDGAKKSQIMYGCFLSFAQNIKYITFLEEKGLLEFNHTTRTYRTTEKGKQFFMTIRQAGAIMATVK